VFEVVVMGVALENLFLLVEKKMSCWVEFPRPLSLKNLCFANDFALMKR
jgi:hypothetical protein